MTFSLFFLSSMTLQADIWANGNFKSIIAIAMIGAMFFLLYTAYRKNDKDMMEKLCSRILPIIGMIIAFYFAAGE